MSAPSGKRFAVKPVLRVFWQHILPYKWAILFVTIGTIFQEAVISTVSPYVAKLIFDRLATAGVSPAAFEQLKPLFFVTVGLGLTAWALRNRVFVIKEKMEAYIMADLEQTSLGHLLGHSFQFFENEFSGTLVRRISRIGRAFEDVYDGVQQRLLPMIVAFTGILFVLFRRSLLVGLLVLLWILIVIAYNYFYTRWKVKDDVARAAQDSLTTGLIADSLSNIVTVKLFSGQPREMSAFESASNKLRNMRVKAWQSHALNYSLQAFVLLLVQSFVLWFSLRAWSRGELSAGDIVLFQSYFTILYGRILDFSRLMRSFYAAFADATEMVEILDLAHSVKDVRGAKALRVGKGAVSFDHASFSYGNGAVLNEFDLQVKPGERVALVGSSGAGKSTIVKLLFRFYDLTGGSISIDGQDIARVTQNSLRSNIALVPQEPVLFHRSLFENIRYGKPDATEKEVIKAAKLAHCHDFIQNLSHGYETLVGERGVKLSGGERQRVAIARAILKNAPILILDEATSSLDSESEGLIQDALHTLMKGKTTIVIAHRLSTIMSMDRIIIMEGGRIADTGTHEELLKQEGLYKKLWNLQVGGFFQDTNA